MKSKFVGNNQFSGKTLEERFWEKVDIGEENECWEWLGARHHKWNYGEFKIGYKVIQAHRWSYFISHENEEIPEGMLVLHTCDNPPCVNPKHLFLGTNDDNMKDMAYKGRSADNHGSKNPNSKLKEQDVIQIKLLKGKVSGAELGRRYGVVKEAIYDIWSGKRWSHVEAQQ
jgi:hypothetical protein